MPHAFVTVAIPFQAERTAAVEAYLDELGNPPAEAVRQKLDDAAFVHFMSMWVVGSDGGAPNHIIIEVNADGTVEEVTGKLAETMGAEISGLLEKAGVERKEESLAKFLAERHQGVGQSWFSAPGVNFDGTPQLTVGQIRREAELAHDVADMLDSVGGKTALATLDAVRERLWNDGAKKWAFVAAPAPSLDPPPPPSRAIGPIVSSLIANFFWPLLALAAVVLIVVWVLGGFALAAWITLVVVAVELGLVLALYLALRRAEQTDIPDDLPPSAERVAECMKREGHAAQSHLAAVSTLKPGSLRYLTLRLGLWFAGILAAHFSRPGFLGSTGVIHFARWILLPGSNKLLFMSNYDGVWESYLEDFIEKASRGVTGIWSNTVGFPKSENLIFKGADDGDRLRRWTRRQQQTTWFWYTAYPDLTLNRIRVNAAIRQGISQAKSEADAADWLACFGSEPTLPGTLETSEIPTLVFGGLGRLPRSRCLFVRLAANVDDAKAWLGGLEAEIAYGDTRGATKAVVAGLSTSGLIKLGLMASDLETFPLAFQHGSTAPWRAKALGDTGRNDPAGWLWGGPMDEVDAILVLYATTQKALDEMTASQRRQARSRGHEITDELPLAPLPTKPDKSGVRVREPFGFADGISQPRIRGAGRATGGDRDIHTVEPGEFIIGYPDNLGYLPPSPSVPAEADPDDILPALGADPFRQRPRFVPTAPNARHDLGRNGTFLVARQLEQDRAGFDAFLQETAARLTADGKAPDTGATSVEDWIAAKMVGRWKDGSSLVRNPLAPSTLSRGSGTAQQDNGFLFEEDPTGQRCPLGAHIRRANPRETFDPGSEQQLTISNRHRILRVGRPYGPDGDGKQGLLFMCLNTDFDRQFGFIQQTWALAPSFHGLEAEVDPFVGVSAKRDLFTIPTKSGPVRVKGLRDFVTVKGGAYFFLPGRQAVRYLCSPNRVGGAGDESGTDQA